MGLVGVVTSVSEDASQAKTAEPFLEAIQDPSTANVTAFAPVNSAFEELANATFNDDEDDSGNDGGEESEDDAGDDEDDSGNDGGEESADDGGDDGDGEDAD